jgi:hypothetical protein
VSAGDDDRLRPALRRADAWRRAVHQATLGGRRTKALLAACQEELALAQADLVKLRAKITREHAA